MSRFEDIRNAINPGFATAHARDDLAVDAPIATPAVGDEDLDPGLLGGEPVEDLNDHTDDEQRRSPEGTACAHAAPTAAGRRPRRHVNPRR